MAKIMKNPLGLLSSQESLLAVPLLLKILYFLCTQYTPHTRFFDVFHIALVAQNVTQRQRC